MLVGCFGKKNGNGAAFTLVNFQDWETHMSATVKFKADGAVTLYRDGFL